MQILFYNRYIFLQITKVMAIWASYLLVSYCGQSMSVVHRTSSVMRRAASTIALKVYSSYTPGPSDMILDRKHRGDL